MISFFLKNLFVNCTVNFLVPFYSSSSRFHTYTNIVDQSLYTLLPCCEDSSWNTDVKHAQTHRYATHIHSEWNLEYVAKSLLNTSEFYTFFFFFSILFCRFICYWIAWYAEFCENTSGLLHQRLWSLLFFFWHPTLEAAFPRETGHVPLQTPKIEVKLSVYSLSVDNCFFHFFVYKCFEYYCWVVLHPRYGEQCAIGGILKTKKKSLLLYLANMKYYFVLCFMLPSVHIASSNSNAKRYLRYQCWFKRLLPLFWQQCYLLYPPPPCQVRVAD